MRAVSSVPAVGRSAADSAARQGTHWGARWTNVTHSDTHGVDTPRQIAPKYLMLWLRLLGSNQRQAD